MGAKGGHDEPWRQPPRVSGLPDWLVAVAGRVVGGPLGLHALQRRHDALPPGLDAPGVARAALAQQGLRGAVVGELPRIAGGVAVIGNHPSGAAEALVALDTLLRWRPDCRFIADAIWTRVPALRPVLIAVDARAAAGDTARNAIAVGTALRWLRAGHALAWFPAGAVGYARRPGDPVSDPPWPAWNARFIARSRATVLPLHFSGANSALFQRVARLRPDWRHALLVREFLAQPPGTVRMTVGAPLAPDDPCLAGDPDAVNARLQARIATLGATAGD